MCKMEFNGRLPMAVCPKATTGKYGAKDNPGVNRLSVFSHGSST
jgi:hypothetical protein